MTCPPGFDDEELPEEELPEEELPEEEPPDLFESVFEPVFKDSDFLEEILEEETFDAAALQAVSDASSGPSTSSGKLFLLFF
jgi:hypothetical protein